MRAAREFRWPTLLLGNGTAYRGPWAPATDYQIGDTVSDGADNCPRIANANQSDADGDGIADHLAQHPEFIQPERYRNEVLSMLGEESGLIAASSSLTLVARATWSVMIPSAPRLIITDIWTGSLTVHT